ncbi:MAG: S8 family serine peptidase [Bacteroidetes bacterium]|nr:S8 family serine peptidase [Bacteroidota bacterium]
MKKVNFIMLLWLLPFAGFASGKYDLTLKSGSIQVTPNLEQFIANQEIQANELFGGKYFRIIQFNDIPSSGQKAALENAGIKLTAYLPNYAYTATINQYAAVASLRAAGARAVLSFQPELKMNNRLRSGDLPDWAVTNKKYIDLVVRYYKGLAADPVVAAILNSGHELIRRYDYSSWIEIRVEISRINEVAALPFVCGVEPIAPPSTPDDEKARSLHRSNVINTYSPMGRHYDGTGVSAALGDDGTVGPHIDYQGRIDQSNAAVNNGTHGDMTTGILMGAGNIDPTIRGMGTGAFIYIYDIGGYNHVLNSPTTNQTLGVMVTSTSYSQGCNDYSVDTQTGDQILNQNPTLLHVYSAGNNGTGDCQYGAGANWGNITGGYKQGKNVIACGNLNYLDALENSSSRGPSEDGRIKPDICANGIDQLSTDGPNDYQVGGGTSAACPGVAGIVTQLHQAFRELNGGTNAEGALIKACLLNTAEDLGNSGPDFKFGWGRVNAYRAVKTLEDNRYLSDVISQGATNNHTITVPANTKQLKLMVYWCDVEGDPLAAKALVNDLNMIVTDPTSTSYNPWILDFAPNPAALNTVAIRGIDDRNNMEQVTINDPAAGSYSIDINGFLIPQGPQKYYIVYEFVTEELEITYPIGYEGFVPGETETIRWDAYGNTGTFNLEYSTDLGSSWNSISANVPAIQRYYNWAVPNTVTGQALVKISRAGFSGQSAEAFSIIGLPANILVDWACPDSIRLTWDPVTNATGYEVSQLGSAYMDSVGYSNTTSIILTGINPTLDYWFSVKAITPDNTKGRRANAIFKGPGVFSCPIAVDASINQLVSPAGSLQNCQDLTSSIISIEVENKGLNSISSIPVYYSINNGPVVAETVTTSLAPFASVTYDFTATFDFSLPGVYNVIVWSDYVADGNHYNDTIQKDIEVFTGLIETLPYSENFETFVNCPTTNDCELTQCGLLNGWQNQTNIEVDDIDFRTSQGSTPSVNTGPDFDHNPGTNTGKYIYLEASACFNKEAIVVSPCFDLTTALTPELKFWYHMYGATMGNLHVDVFANGVWQNDVIPLITGNQGTIWLEGTANLTPFIGGIINIRFRGNTGNDYTSDIAIDDIGVYETSAPPAVSFVASSTNICVGQTITLTDLTQNNPASWSWNITPASGFNFVNGTSATSQNPQVQFTTAGFYDVGLTATNGFGNNTLVIPSYIWVGTGAATTLVETFQGPVYPPLNWNVENPDNALSWSASAPITGITGTTTIASFIDNFAYNAAGEEDGLITERVDLNNALQPIITFDVSHARYSVDFEDALRLDISTDCGLTYVPTGYLKQGVDLATSADQNTLFAPTTSLQWRTDTFDLVGFIGQEVIVKFVNITGYGNSLYIDNINFKESTVGINDEITNTTKVDVFPNPGKGEFMVNIQTKTGETTSFKVFDLKGSVISEMNINLNKGINKIPINISDKNKGIYLLEINSESINSTIKLVVL